MFNKFYEQELQNLRELAVEFSRVHPAAAPMLSGPSADLVIFEESLFVRAMTVTELEERRSPSKSSMYAVSCVA